ncbi:restriction endonuclease subunit S [Photobacterium leiognathi]|uniref:restriction endonuclease subunit S n=1 Tax=Photobacterium leiognathi TaxID=553611 RepID=UPI002981EE65|nr:restriction endonuclease subunit S [Photobacterium leiognathi]
MNFNRMLTIGDVAKVFDGPHATPKKIDTGPYFLSISSLENGKLDLSKSAHLSDEDFAKWTRRVTPEAGDILFSYETRLGEVAMMPAGVTACLGRRMGLLRPDRTKILPEYLLYAYQSNAFQEVIRAKTIHGATVDRIALKELPSFPIQVPPLKEQQKIVDILKGYDRKLVLNLETNQTLEQMAQAIFKSWFVDFDPVKAKMNGEQPEGMDATTASLFPEKLVESELGLIPDGWEVSTLSSLIKLTGGGTPKRSEEIYWNGDIPWFSVRDVPSGSNVFVVDTDEKITELGLNKSSTKLLPKGTTIITARGTVGKLALVGTDMCMNQSCYGIRGKEVGDFYNYFNLNEAVSTLQRNTHGAVFDTITTKTFDTYSMAFSGAELANKFDALVAPLLQKIEANVRQNIELATLRDTLLPKLLSGEIELGTSEELVEAI